MRVDKGQRNSTRLVWTLILGFFLGGILTEITERFLPDSAARSFLTSAVSASVGPFSMDLLSVSFTLGPVLIYLNVLTLVGVFIVAFIARSWI